MKFKFERFDSTVYRVQDADGRGPWKPGMSHLWTEDRSPSEYEILKPWNHEFTGLAFRDGFHVGCACESIQQLRKWFTFKEYHRLTDMGYRCVAIGDADVVARNEFQCVIQRSKPLYVNAKAVELYPAKAKRKGQ